MSNKTTSLTVFTLAMLITGSIDSIRNLPTTALFGSNLIFFLIFAAMVFLLPTALISAQLAAAWPQQGGVYNWVKMAYGKKIALIAIWLQWINTMVWFPTILSFIAGTAAYLIAPDLAHSKMYLVIVILSLFWLMTLLNLKGLHTSAKLASIATVIGMIIPMALIIGLAAIWIIIGKPLQLHLHANNLIPTLHHSQNWISLTAIMASFLGMELATVHVTNIKNAQTVFPKALIISVITIIVTMLAGSLAIAFILPIKNIHLVDGVMQAFSDFFHAYHLSWLIPVITIMLVIGSLGGLINWLISPAKGLLQAAADGFLPKFFQQQNQHGVPSNLLIIQAILVSVICLAFLLMPSINGSYWLLTDLSTELYMFMYLLMFIAAIKLSKQINRGGIAFAIPCANAGTISVSCLGLGGCLIAIGVGFLPPENIAVGSAFHYDIIFISSILIMLAPLMFFYQHAKKLHT